MMNMTPAPDPAPDWLDDALRADGALQRSAYIDDGGFTAGVMATLPAPVAALPDGAMVADGEASYLVAGGSLLRWTPAGYREGPGRLAAARLLTPPSTVRALAAGYRAVLHPSATAPRRAG